MDPITVVALIIFILALILGFRAYIQHRQGLNKKESEARLGNKEFKKPSVLDDSKTCLSIIVLIIVGVIVLSIVYAILHWLYPGMFPSINVN